MTITRQRRSSSGKRGSVRRQDDAAPTEDAVSANRRAAAMSNIVLTAIDYYGLSSLAADHATAHPEMTEGLIDELERAEVLPFGVLPEDLVSLGSRVTLLNHASGFEQELTLVLPDESDALLAKISVLSPIGLALIGCRVGASTTWSTPARHMHRVTVTAVRNARCPEPQTPTLSDAVN
jgi:regulator of nucleoside diphosphate kinase